MTWPNLMMAGAALVVWVFIGRHFVRTRQRRRQIREQRELRRSAQWYKPRY
jgi:uncharacterized membrane-anchored protein YhcB (DUF1043 family)